MRFKTKKPQIKNEKYFAVPLHLLPTKTELPKKENLHPDFGKRNDFGFPITGRRSLFSK
jgi:hypothetical protein